MYMQELVNVSCPLSLLVCLLYSLLRADLKMGLSEGVHANKNETRLLFHSGIDHGVSALHSLWSALETFMRSFGDNHFHLLPGLRPSGQTLAHHLLYLLGLFAFRHVRRCIDTLSLLQSLV